MLYILSQLENNGLPFVLTVGSFFVSIYQCGGSFIRSFVSSIIRSFVRSFVRTFIRSLVDMFVRSFFPSFIRKFACLLVLYWCCLVSFALFRSVPLCPV